ncbi:class I SAM-dependent methyltransferase [Halocatena pleomorpha]|uniref:Class I SAM-dependent methyltransferase n=1 Tax=Halocatena pleomorpha TaxID=1785090 RepID=A0A3P3RLB5_9EURY|nr:class I SAM-dependent methyltransferase [Halocatena pleomorpha]RRJ34232.1 class I SAM-dependent methyltransferase [Halocatena pleomorpha]
MTDARESWGDWYEKVEGDIDPDVVELREQLEEEDKDSVLDVGCGAGRHLLYLTQNELDAHGFDFSESAVAKLRGELDELGAEADVQVADMAEKFPYDGEQFDTVLAIRSIHHADLSTINHSVDEIFRVLRPSGLIYVQVPTYEKLEKLRGGGEEFEEVEPGTNIPLKGPEEGVPHHNFKREEVHEIFSDFEIEALDKRDDHYNLLARKAP